MQVGIVQAPQICNLLNVLASRMKCKSATIIPRFCKIQVTAYFDLIVSRLNLLISCIPRGIWSSACLRLIAARGAHSSVVVMLVRITPNSYLTVRRAIAGSIQSQ